jgi:hypothetical protein
MLWNIALAVFIFCAGFVIGKGSKTKKSLDLSFDYFMLQEWIERYVVNGKNKVLSKKAASLLSDLKY